MAGMKLSVERLRSALIIDAANKHFGEFARVA